MPVLCGAGLDRFGYGWWHKRWILCKSWARQLLCGNVLLSIMGDCTFCTGITRAGGVVVQYVALQA
jgi:hypothetical protein